MRKFPPRVQLAITLCPPAALYRDALAVFALALGLRLLLSVLLANTYDPDEFVYLALGHDVAQGAVPYRDFAFFHPPGILVILAALNQLIAWWWPLARLVDVALDSVTAVLVWRLGLQVYGRRPAIAAGILYATCPLTLVSAVRVDQEVVMTLLGVAGLTLLVTRRSHGTALVAGSLLAAAAWVKYPMLVYVPVALLVLRATPRRAAFCLLGFGGAAALLFAPYLGHFHQLVTETILWQVAERTHTDLVPRLETVGVAWLLLSPFALVALRRVRSPLWLLAGFASGGVYLFTSSVYSHYFVPVVPFAAVLGAPVAAAVVRLPARILVLGASVATLVLAAAMQGWAGDHGFIIAARFAAIRPVIQRIDRTTSPGTHILTDHFEYAYLADRPWVAHYFWDQHTFVSARVLERRLAPRSLVVQSQEQVWTVYPRGLGSYLRAHFSPSTVGNATVWHQIT